MKLGSLRKDLNFENDKVDITVIMETDVSKEIRILFKEGQVMKEHKAGSPILVEVHEGIIDFGVIDTIKTLTQGDLIYLDANVPHNLTAKKNSIVRLSLFKFNEVDRV